MISTESILGFLRKRLTAFRRLVAQRFGNGDSTAQNEAKDARRALIESEERFRSAFEQAAIGMALVSTDGHFLQVNDKLCAIAGYGREELQRMTFSDLTVREERMHGEAALAAMLNGTLPSYAVEKRYVRKDGGTVWVNVAATLCRTASGGAIYFIAFMEDITARKLAEAALRTSEANMAAAQRVARFGSWELELGKTEGNANSLRWSDEMFRIAGYEPGAIQITTEFFFSLVPPEERPAIRETVARAIADRVPYSIVHRLIRQDGEERIIQETAQVFMDETIGLPAKMVGTAHDITEQREAEAAILKSEQEQRTLNQQLEAERARLIAAQAVAKVGSWETDLATMSVLWSAETFRIFEVSPEQFSPTHERFLTVVHPEDRAAVDQAFVQTLDQNSEGFVRHRIVMPDGRIKFVEERWRAVRDPSGTPVRAIGTCQDVTERTKAEEKIHEQAALLDQARDAIHVHDLEGNIQYWNKGAERCFGWAAEEAVGQKVQDLICEDLDRCANAMEATSNRGGWLGEMEKRAKSGSRVLVESRWSLVHDVSGRPKSMLVINTDVTEKRRIETQFFRAQRMESIGTLAGGIAHDLNNVLGPIIMAVDLLNSTVTDPRDRDLLDLMETSARRGADMVKQVLYFARGIEGHRSIIQPAFLVRELQKIARDTFPKSISVEGGAPPDVWNTEGDRTHIHQVLLNLCVNARDAMPEGGVLRISARNRIIDAQFAAMQPDALPGSYVTFEVVDTGEGMRPEVMARIFEPFFTTKQIGKGTGLGLSTAHAIVKGHGGFLTVKSELGKGTAFEVNLPAESGLAVTEAETAPLDLPRGTGETILIIDDESAIRSITGQTLEAFGYRVMSAGDGAEGVSIYAQNMNVINAVLTDLTMPVMDGVATIRVLRRLKPGAIIIAASGLASSQAEEEAKAAGVDCFLPKPYAAEALLRCLHCLLHQDAPGQP